MHQTDKPRLNVPPHAFLKTPKLCQVTCPIIRLCDLVTDIGIMTVAWQRPQLTSLQLGCELITDAGVVAVAQHCQQLTSLTLR